MELQPFSSNDRNAPVILSTLPPDIIRLVIRAADSPMEQIRLISPSWNAMVLQYHSERRNNPPLEAVHLQIGTPEQESDVIVKVEMKPDHHFRGPFKGWTSNGDVFQSPSLRVRVIEWDRSIVVAASIMFIIETLTVAWRLHYSISIAIVIVAIGLLVRLVTQARPGVIETRKKLAFIFSRCSSIESLHVHNVNRETLDVVRKLLGDVPINNLVVYDENCEKDLRAMIVSMAQVHKIERITVCAKKLEQKRLSNFFLSATETAKRLEIYESTEKDSGKIFKRDQQFWEKKSKEMSDGSFCVSIMDGQQLLNGHGSQLLRLRITA